jgi:hypothetical protein
MTDNTFTWHEVSEKEREQIRKDSKKLLNEFAGKLERIKAPEGHFENGSGLREEGDGWNSDEDFMNIMFANASFVEEDSIVAEKGGWKA